MLKNIPERAGNFHFKPIESSAISFEELLSFLNVNYTSGSDVVQVRYRLDYLRWFFSQGGVLGLLTTDEEWVAIFCVGTFLLRHGSCQSSVFNSGPLCVNKSHLFKNHAQKVIEETSNYVKNKYKMPILGAGVTGVKKDAIFKRFGMYLGENIEKPSSSCFSSNNLFLCDESSFLKKFENKEGFLLHYTQNVKYKNKNEKWGIVVSYHTTGCWKQMVYDFGATHLGNYDRVLIFENLERKGDELEDMGLKKFTAYNLYVDSPINLPEYFLYYNLFLF